MKKFNKKATSLIEVMVILLIVTIGILGAFKVFSGGQKLSVNTKNKIQAINIAREGIEAITNIRNTNWFLFSSDNISCWNSFNYNQNCIGDKHSYSDLYINSGSYIIYSSGAKWFLGTGSISGNYDYSNSNYRNHFQVYKTASGFYTQTGVLNSTKFTFKPNFTREIQISYSGTALGSESFSGSQMIIKSKVFWSDVSSSNPNKVILSTILTPWKD